MAQIFASGVDIQHRFLSEPTQTLLLTGLQEPRVSDQIELQKIVGQVAAAYFANSHVTPSEIPTVISNIAAAVGAVGATPVKEAPPEEAPAPEQPKATAAQIRRSITHDKLISFEDGKGYKTLRRHLAVKNLTPQDYRNKWGLPGDYPMVAPGYSEARSNMAKAAGFGRPPATAAAKSAPARAVAAAAPAAPAVAAPPIVGERRPVVAKRTVKGGAKAGRPRRTGKPKAASGSEPEA